MAPADTTTAGSGPLTERVRASCAKLVARERSAVRVNADKVREFTDALDWTEFESLAVPDRFPLNFRSRQDEINFLGAPDACWVRSTDGMDRETAHPRRICVLVSAAWPAQLRQRLPQGPAQVHGPGTLRYFAVHEGYG